MADVLPASSLRPMDNSWSGHWYNTDQAPLDSVFEELDVEEPSQQQYTAPMQAINMPQNTFGAFQQEYNAALPAGGANTIPASPMTPFVPNSSNHHISSFSSPVPSASNYSFPGQVFTGNMRTQSPYSSVHSTPLISPVLPSQQFRPIEAAFDPSTVQGPNLLKRSQLNPDVQRLETLSKRRISHDTVKHTELSGEDAAGPELSDDEKLLLRLKQDNSLSWKEISKEFEDRLGRPYQVPALQMRYKRLRERLRLWKEEDVSALEAAYEYWESNKYEIIAQKMLDFGISERWPAKLVEKKWQQLHTEDDKTVTKTPGTSQQMPIRAFPKGLEDYETSQLSDFET